MNAGLLSAYVSYAVIAAAVALLYLAATRLLRAAGDYLYRRRRVLRRQPGEAVRRELRANGKRLATHLNACLLAAVVFGLLVVLGRRGWWPDWSLRIWVTLAVLLLVPQAYALVKLVLLLVRRWRLLRLLGLHDAVAERLGEAQLRGNRVHYAVPSDAGYIDAVVVGGNGLYALLLVPTPRGSEAVSLAGGQLRFEPGGQLQAVEPFRQAIRALARNVEAGTGRAVVVQTVLVVPDCRIDAVDDPTLLLVNLPACVSFVGWRNPAAFLMDEEVRAVDAWLATGHPGRDPAGSGAVQALDQTRRFASRVLPQV